MTQKIAIHKDAEQFPNSLWWKPFFAWQKQMSDTLQKINPAFMPPALWEAEDSAFGGMQHNINQMFGTLFNHRQMLTPWWMGKQTEPYVDILEKEKVFVVKADLPGVDAEDLDVSVSDQGALIIKGENSEETRTEGATYIRRECCSGSFSRTIALPDGADLDNAAATFNRNVLTIEIPKKAGATAKTRQLTIASHDHKQKKVA